MSIKSQAQYLWNITNSSGKSLNQGVLSGSTSTLPSSSLQWSNLSNPNDVTWKIWKKLSEKYYKLKPHCILGYWISSPSKRNKTHRYQYFKSLNEIFISDSYRINRWCVSNIESNNFKCINYSSDDYENLPEDCIPVIKKENLFYINCQHCTPERCYIKRKQFDKLLKKRDSLSRRIVKDNITKLHIVKDNENKHFLGECDFML